MKNLMFEKLLKMAFMEELNHVGDVTSDAIFEDQEDCYHLVAKQDGLLCGVDCFTSAFHYIDKDCEVTFFFSDGDILKKGATVASIQGRTGTLLKAERVALNFIAHLSGIATQTRMYVNAVSGRTKILDTRKTMPGWRELQKYAVMCGGGTNHRMGLHDMVMIKDNHIDGVGGITRAVERVRRKWKDRFKVEVETRNLQEVQEALKAGVDVIMLDNMDTSTMARAVKMIHGRAETEASGNMDLSRVQEVSKAGVDYISVGALTHSVTAFDFSIKKRIESGAFKMRSREISKDCIMMRAYEDASKMKRDLGSSLVIPAHHYEMDEIVEQADFLGDSYKLAKDCSQTEAEYIVFGGVNFMAEGAALLAKPHQKVLTPDRSAKCPMADMIDAGLAGKAHAEISRRCEREVVPLVYMNSYVDMKAFCGAHGGTVCTSSNAAKIVQNFLDAGKSVFFAPDYNLGINTANALGIHKDEVITVKRDLSLLGRDPARAKLFLWDGFCYVHKAFTTGDAKRLRERYADIKIIVHPECDESLVSVSDYSGSTSMIYNTVKDAPPGTTWGIGTEYRFVARMAREFKDKTIVPLRESICRDMSEITLEKLAVSLRSISQWSRGEGPLKHRVAVPETYRNDARRALQRMIDIVEENI